MPELPEVEVVRRGIQDWALAQPIAQVEVLDDRSLRRQLGGTESFIPALTGASFESIRRRGKYLWAPLNPAGASQAPTQALVFHLGMSGQVLMARADIPDPKHLKIRLTFQPLPASVEPPLELRFVDQRIFGGLFINPLIPTHDVATELIPEAVSHIGRDPLDELFDTETMFRALRGRKTGIKRALLDQSLSSGIGNIYADEALWRAKLHFARPTETLTRNEVARTYRHAREVMEEALEQGGTSFDALYVNVEGNSGYFERSLNVYGREGLPCPRCAQAGEDTPIRRTKFMNRSAYYCPRCQPVPRRARW